MGNDSGSTSIYRDVRGITYDEFVNDPDRFEQVRGIVRAVILRHFCSGYNYVFEDLEQVGLLKATNMLQVDYYVPGDRSGAYLYTGIRNEIGNFLYHENKYNKNKVELYISDDGEQDLQYEDDTDFIEDICDLCALEDIKDRVCVRIPGFRWLVDRVVNNLLNGYRERDMGIKERVVCTVIRQEVINEE